MRWPFDAFPYRGPASGDVHGRTRASRGPERSREGEARFANEFARALLVAFRAPGSPERTGVRSGDPPVAAPAKIREADGASRKATALLDRGAFRRDGTPYATGSVTMSPTRARRDRGPITPPPWRHCSGARAPFHPHRHRLPLTRKAMVAARFDKRREPKPRRIDEPQRPSRLLRPNQLAG